MSTGLTQMHDLAASHMRDLRRDARLRAEREAVRRGRSARKRPAEGR